MFYGVYFLILGLEYLLDEREIKMFDPDLVVSKQRINIILMHLTGFLILSYIPGELRFDGAKLLVGLGGLVFLLFAFLLSGRVFRRSCPLLWNGVFFLMDVSLIFLERLDHALAERQLIWMFVGFVASLAIPFILNHLPRFEKLEWVYLIGGVVLVCLPFVMGTEKNGAKNWIWIGDFSLQPSEFVKFLYVFYLASVLRKARLFVQLIPPTIVAAAFVLMLVWQTDLGGALIFFMTYMVMLYIATGRLSLFVLGMGSFSVASWFAYRIFPHIRVRVSAYLNPLGDFFNTGNQMSHSLFAIGTWGLLGSGLTRGMPYRIPVVENDFIFAAIVEEFGGIFGMCLIAIYVVLYYRGVHVSLRLNHPYHSLLAAGLTAMLAFQTFLILGGVIKFIPLTGVTLPFVSYGGTSMVVSLLMVGFIQWLYARFGEMPVTEVDKSTVGKVK